LILIDIIKYHIVKA